MKGKRNNRLAPNSKKSTDPSRGGSIREVAYFNGRTRNFSYIPSFAGKCWALDRATHGRERAKSRDEKAQKIHEQTPLAQSKMYSNHGESKGLDKNERCCPRMVWSLEDNQCRIWNSSIPTSHSWWPREPPHQIFWPRLHQEQYNSYPHSSHYLQPLEFCCFMELKDACRSRVSEDARREVLAGGHVRNY